MVPLPAGVIHGKRFQKAVHSGALECVTAAVCAEKALHGAGESSRILHSRHAYPCEGGALSGGGTGDVWRSRCHLRCGESDGAAPAQGNFGRPTLVVLRRT